MALQLLHILITQIQSREVPSLASLRPNEDAAIIATLKVSLALDRAIVFARGLVERNADPVANAGNLGYEANIGHRASSSIAFREEANAARECQTCLYELAAVV